MIHKIPRWVVEIIYSMALGKFKANPQFMMVNKCSFAITGGGSQEPLSLDRKAYMNLQEAIDSLQNGMWTDEPEKIDDSNYN